MSYQYNFLNGYGLDGRYRIIAESDSGHCCFEYSVMDTETLYYPDRQNEEALKGKIVSVCECFGQEDAEMICRALNQPKP